ncbi:MAG TPA: DUF6498-containing protein [Panacibacter sp.]|nr:DUF6498-containing protein [Panacibacter sp.]
MFKKYFTNPSLLFLIAGNLYCIWYYENHPGGFATIVWIYWLQSIIIGFFNFLDLLTIKNYDATDFKINNEPVTEKNSGCIAWFFLLHYGFFHLGYCIFLLIDFGISTVDKNFLLLGAGAFLMESLLGFIKRRQLENEIKPNIGSIFFLPYLRILPMHLMILLPAFTGIQPSLIFLILKMAADIFSYMLFHFVYSKNSK